MYIVFFKGSSTPTYSTSSNGQCYDGYKYSVVQVQYPSSSTANNAYIAYSDCYNYCSSISSYPLNIYNNNIPSRTTLNSILNGATFLGLRYKDTTTPFQWSDTNNGYINFNSKNMGSGIDPWAVSDNNKYSNWGKMYNSVYISKDSANYWKWTATLSSSVYQCICQMPCKTIAPSIFPTFAPTKAGASSSSTINLSVHRLIRTIYNVGKSIFI